jgi:hypothetical protein
MLTAVILLECFQMENCVRRIDFILVQQLLQHGCQPLLPKKSEYFQKKKLQESR